VKNVGFHSTFDESTPIPIDFVGYAVVTSPQPVAAVLIRGKQTSYLSGVNEPAYTAVSGVPRDRGETEWFAPVIYRRYTGPQEFEGLWNSWLQVQVVDGSTAQVTLRFVGEPGTNCAKGPFQTTFEVKGSKVFYMNADADNGFPAGGSPACFRGSAKISSDKNLIVIASVLSDSFPGGDNEGLYNAVPKSHTSVPLAAANNCAAETACTDELFLALLALAVAHDEKWIDAMNAYFEQPTEATARNATTATWNLIEALGAMHPPVSPQGAWFTWDREHDASVAKIARRLHSVLDALEQGDEDLVLIAAITANIAVGENIELWDNQPEECK
jgi:hypothetical protein